MKIKYLGNKELLNKKTIGFLSSRNISQETSNDVLEWAKNHIKDDDVVVCGNVQSIESKILGILLKSRQNIILVLANAIEYNLNDEIITALKEGRLLMLSKFDFNVKRFSENTSLIRNELIVSISKELKLGDIRKGGNIEKLLCDKQENEQSALEDKKMFEILRKWRKELAIKMNVPAYIILHDSVLKEIANKKPLTKQELSKIKGMGERRIMRYSDDILNILIS